MWKTYHFYFRPFFLPLFCELKKLVKELSLFYLWKLIRIKKIFKKLFFQATILRINSLFLGFFSIFSFFHIPPLIINLPIVFFFHFVLLYFWISLYFLSFYTSLRGTNITKLSGWFFSHIICWSVELSLFYSYLFMRYLYLCILICSYQQQKSYFFIENF